MQAVRALYANRWVRYAATILLLALVVNRVHPGQILDAMRTARPAYVLFALVLTLPFLFLKAGRWYLMLRAAGVDATPAEAMISLVGGMGLALVTPARLGELVRVAYIRNPQKWKIGGLVMIDKAFDVLVLTGLSILGAWKLLGPSLGALFLFAAVVGLIVVYVPGPLSHLLHGVASKTPMRARFEAVLSSMQSLSPRSTTQFLTLTLIAFAVVLAQFGIILLCWRSWSPEIVLFTFPLVVLTNVMPITIGGLGVREGVAALLLSHYGVSSADAALAAFLMFALNTALPGLVGALILPAVHLAVPVASTTSLDRS